MKRRGMINGIYIYESEEKWNQGIVKIQLKETEKSWVLTLLENTIRYCPAQLEMLFKNKGRAVVNKEHSEHYHEFRYYEWGNTFLIYPYRAGIPFLFREQKNI